MQEMRDNKFQLQPANFVNTFAVGYDNIGSFVQEVTSSVDKAFDGVPEEDRKAVASSKLRLLIGAAIVNDIRRAVKTETKYECSAGIAHNKILAKLTCGMNKPNKQTILPIESITGLYQDLGVNKVKSLGGKLGEEVCAKLNVKTMADLLNISEIELQNHFPGRIGSWLYLMARGIELEKVTPKFMSKSIAVSKNFRGKSEISSVLTLKHWLKELANEIVERLEKDEADCKRFAKQLIVSFTQGGLQKDVSSSRTVQLNGNSLNSYTAEQIAEEALETIKKNSAKFLKGEGTVLMNQNIKHLGISAGKFEDFAAPGAAKNLLTLLNNHQKKEVCAGPRTPPTATKKESLGEPSPLQSIKKFEMKSPKPMIAEATVGALRSKASTSSNIPGDVNGTILEESLKMSEKFPGDHSIQGITTLKHWIEQLLSKLCGKLDCLKHERAPTTLVLRYNQQDLSETNTVRIPLESFTNGVIDVNAIVEVLIQSKGFLSADEKRIQHPIDYLELVPSEFESEEWRYVIKGTLEEFQEVEPLSEVETLKLDDHEAEEETEEPQQLSDKDFFRNELMEISKTEESFPTEFEEESQDYGMFESCDVVDPKDAPIEEPRNDQIAMKAGDAPGPSYIKTYAEFQPQSIALELLNPKETCMACGKMIGKLDMVIHLDHHFALQLATQQREEYRQKMIALPNKSSASTNASKKTTKTKTKPITNSIQKYAFKMNESLDEDADDNKIKCEQCQKSVAIDDYVCHLDYHFAQKLREAEIKKKGPAKIDTKRKRPGSSQKNQPKEKSLKTYFTT